MRRRCFNLAAAASLVLCVATAGLWVRSRDHMDSAARNWGHRRGISSSCCAGKLFIDYWRAASEMPTVRNGWYFSFDPGVVGFIPAPAPHYYFAGFGYVKRTWLLDGTWATTEWWVIPLWLPLLVTMPLPACWGWRKGRIVLRRGRGHCPTCGYDLRATPERCPECGTAAGAR